MIGILSGIIHDITFKVTPLLSIVIMKSVFFSNRVITWCRNKLWKELHFIHTVYFRGLCDSIWLVVITNFRMVDFPAFFRCPGGISKLCSHSTRNYLVLYFCDVKYYTLLSLYTLERYLCLSFRLVYSTASGMCPVEI